MAEIFRDLLEKKLPGVGRNGLKAGDGVETNLDVVLGESLQKRVRHERGIALTKDGDDTSFSLDCGQGK
jgi:hypothetical protein